MTFFQATDFEVFHFDEPLFHLLFQIGFDITKACLQFLIVIQLQALFLDGQTTFVFLVKLALNRGFHLGFSLFQSLMLFDTVLFVHGLDLTF